MVGVNLIPAYRHGARRRSKRLRRWTGVCAAYAAVLLVVYGGARAVWGGGGRAIEEEAARAAVQISESAERITQLQQKLFESQRLLAANRVLADQPDWSLLLAMLSDALGEEIVLKSCKLHPAGAPRGPAAFLSGPAADPEGGFRLAITGYGRSLTVVSQFVLRLERTRLFQEVRTVKTNREAFLAGRAIAFELDCVLANRGEAKK